MHQISKEIDSLVKDDLILLDEITGGVVENRRRVDVLRKGVRLIRGSARSLSTLARYRLCIAVSFAFVIVVWLLLW